MKLTVRCVIRCITRAIELYGERYIRNEYIDGYFAALGLFNRVSFCTQQIKRMKEEKKNTEIDENLLK